jgi:hypothetical protein
VLEVRGTGTRDKGRNMIARTRKRMGLRRMIPSVTNLHGVIGKAVEVRGGSRCGISRGDGGVVVRW